MRVRDRTESSLRKRRQGLGCKSMSSSNEIIVNYVVILCWNKHKYVSFLPILVYGLYLLSLTNWVRVMNVLYWCPPLCYIQQKQQEVYLISARKHGI